MKTLGCINRVPKQLETSNPKGTSDIISDVKFLCKVWEFLTCIEKEYIHKQHRLLRKNLFWSFIENAHSGGPGLHKQSQAPQIQQALRRDSKAVLWSPRKPLHFPYGRFLFWKESKNIMKHKIRILVIVKENSCPVKICSVKIFKLLSCGCCFLLLVWLVFFLFCFVLFFF